MLLALWGGLCAFVATVLHNFASYAAALAGYTAAIIAADTLGATGGPSADVFMLAVYRASEICIGIVCAGIVLAGTDLGGAQRRLAASFADLAAEIAGRFTRMLALAGPQLPDTQPERRELVRRVIALDPVIDQAIGESSQVRYHSPTLQTAVHGLFRALDGWRGVATHLSRLPDDVARQEADAVLRSIPPELRSAQEPRFAGALDGRSHGPAPRLRGRRCGRCSRCRPARHRCGCSPTRRPRCWPASCTCSTGWRCSSTLPAEPRPGRRGFRLSVPDWLPALVNAARAFVTIGAVELFWIVTAWPNGASAIVFVAIVVLLLSPRGDLAYAGARSRSRSASPVPSLARPSSNSRCCRRSRRSRPSASPSVFTSYRSALPWPEAGSPRLSPCSPPWPSTSCRSSSPTNQMSYDTAQFYNTALAIVVGCGDRAACISPAAAAVAGTADAPPARPHLARPAPPRDRRAAADARRIGRAACTAGSRHCRTRPSRCSARNCWRRCRSAPRSSSFATWLHALARPRSSTQRLRPSRREIARSRSSGCVNSTSASASGPDGRPETVIALRARGRILVLSEALAAHGSYFDAGARA